MTAILPEDKKWQEAFVRYAFDAAVGRLFKGIIHNLNGVGQAFMMQTELLNMMFSQTDSLFAEIEQAGSPEEKDDKIAALHRMLKGRANLAGLLSGEVEILQKTMQRTSLIVEAEDRETPVPYSLKSVIDLEMEFLKSDGFFKHKITKNLVLAEDLPDLSGHRIELHQIISILLENASQAFAEESIEVTPEISIEADLEKEIVVIKVCDNGPGINPDNLERIFEPFFTTRQGRLGMGLHLARTMAESCGGSLICESVPYRTCFVFRRRVN